MSVAASPAMAEPEAARRRQRRRRTGRCRPRGAGHRSCRRTRIRPGSGGGSRGRANPTSDRRPCRQGYGITAGSPIAVGSGTSRCLRCPPGRLVGPRRRAGRPRSDDAGRSRVRDGAGLPSHTGDARWWIDAQRIVARVGRRARRGRARCRPLGPTGSNVRATRRGIRSDDGIRPGSNILLVDSIRLDRLERRRDDVARPHGPVRSRPRPEVGGRCSDHDSQGQEADHRSVEPGRRPVARRDPLLECRHRRVRCAHRRGRGRIGGRRPRSRPRGAVGTVVADGQGRGGQGRGGRCRGGRRGPRDRRRASRCRRRGHRRGAVRTCSSGVHRSRRGSGTRCRGADEHRRGGQRHGERAARRSGWPARAGRVSDLRSVRCDAIGHDVTRHDRTRHDTTGRTGTGRRPHLIRWPSRHRAHPIGPHRRHDAIVAVVPPHRGTTS